MDTKPLILLDMDGVLADLTGRMRELVHDRVPGHQFPEVIENWHLRTGRRGTDDMVQAIFCEDGFFGSLDPMPGAREAVRALRDEADVRFCSTPFRSNATCARDKAEWVVRHFGQGSDRDLVLTADKTLVHGDVLVDDRPDIVGISTPTWTQVVYSHPYNLGMKMPRMRAWDDEGIALVLAVAREQADQRPGTMSR